MAFVLNFCTKLWPFRSNNTNDAGEKCDKSNKTTISKTNLFGQSWESYAVMVQSILIWEKPLKSTIAVLIVNIIFWSITLSDISLIVVVSLAAFMQFFHQQWVDKIWPEIRVPPKHQEDTEEWTPIHPQVLSVPEITAYVDSAYRSFMNCAMWLITLRGRQPAIFCVLMTTLCSLSAFIGILLPGVILVYILLMLVMTCSGIWIRLIPDSLRTSIKSILTGGNTMFNLTHSIDSDLSEFLPEERTLEAQVALEFPFLSHDPAEIEESFQQPDQRRSILRRRKMDKEKSLSPLSQSLPITTDGNGTSYFTYGLPEDFPSYDNDNMNDLDGPDIEIPDIMPSLTQESIPYDPLSPPTSVAHPSEIKFVSSHFGCSREEDDDFMKGLTFPQQTRQEREPESISAPSSSITQSLPVMEGLNSLLVSTITQNASVITSLGHNLLASVIGQAQQIQHLSSTSGEQRSGTSIKLEEEEEYISELDEDFEVISDDGLQ